MTTSWRHWPDGVAYVVVVNARIVYPSPEQSSTGSATQMFTAPSNLVAIDVIDGAVL